MWLAGSAHHPVAGGYLLGFVLEPEHWMKSLAGKISSAAGKHQAAGCLVAKMPLHWQGFDHFHRLALLAQEILITSGVSL